MFQRKQNCCGFDDALLSLMIGLRGAFDSGGVCGDGERLCKCSSLIGEGDAATSSRSPSSIDDRFAGICANVDDDNAGGVNEARGDNSGVVDVLDIASFASNELFSLRLTYQTLFQTKKETNLNTFRRRNKRRAKQLKPKHYCEFLLHCLLQSVLKTLFCCVSIDMHMNFRFLNKVMPLEFVAKHFYNGIFAFYFRVSLSSLVPWSYQVFLLWNVKESLYARLIQRDS